MSIAESPIIKGERSKMIQRIERLRRTILKRQRVMAVMALTMVLLSQQNCARQSSSDQMSGNGGSYGGHLIHTYIFLNNARVDGSSITIVKGQSFQLGWGTYDEQYQCGPTPNGQWALPDGTKYADNCLTYAFSSSGTFTVRWLFNSGFGDGLSEPIVEISVSDQ